MGMCVLFFKHNAEPGWGINRGEEGTVLSIIHIQPWFPPCLFTTRHQEVAGKSRLELAGICRGGVRNLTLAFVLKGEKKKVEGGRGHPWTIAGNPTAPPPPVLPPISLTD